MLRLMSRDVQVRMFKRLKRSTARVTHRANLALPSRDVLGNDSWHGDRVSVAAAGIALCTLKLALLPVDRIQEHGYVDSVQLTANADWLAPSLGNGSGGNPCTKVARTCGPAGLDRHGDFEIHCSPWILLQCRYRR